MQSLTTCKSLKVAKSDCCEYLIAKIAIQHTDTWFLYKDKHSTILLPLVVQLWAGWIGTNWGCACQCGRPCACTDQCHQGHLCMVCSPRFPLHCPPRMSLLCSFSENKETYVNILECITRCFTS